MARLDLIDSGVAWLGSIPRNWRVARIADHTLLIAGHPFSSDGFNATSGRPLVRIRDLDNDTTEVFYQGDYAGAAMIDMGDTIIGMDGDFNAARWRGGQALLNQRMCCLRPKPTIDGRFLSYLLPIPLRAINELAYFTTVKHLSNSDIRSIRFGLPSLHEQRLIADFLDRETAKIDGLLANQAEFLTLLDEHRRALITDAVTKGLDPSVPMQETGIPAFPHIPADWTVKRLKRVSPRITVGVVVNPSTYVSDEGRPFFFGGDVTDDGLSDRTVRRISPEDNARNIKSVLNTGDLVMVRVGYPGLTAVVGPEHDGANCASMVIIGRSNTFNSDWLCHTLNSAIGKWQIDVVKYGAAQEQFNVAHAVEFRVPVPPLDEQRCIADHLTAQANHLRSLRTRSASLINHLHERRSALITAAVTGQIDVTQSAPKLAAA
jgi:type I restriction enzyme, S subunit